MKILFRRKWKFSKESFKILNTFYLDKTFIQVDLQSWWKKFYRKKYLILKEENKRQKLIDESSFICYKKWNREPCSPIFFIYFNFLSILIFYQFFLYICYETLLILLVRRQYLDGSRTTRREKRTIGRTPPRARGTASTLIPSPPPRLLLLLCRDQSSGVYRCPGRQLGVLRFALRETVAFLRLFRPLHASYSAVRGTGSLALRARALDSRARRLGFSPKGVLSLALSLWFLARFSPCDLNLPYIPHHNVQRARSLLIIKIYFWSKYARVLYFK